MTEVLVRGFAVWALLRSSRYALTNVLLLALIAAFVHGGWPIWAVLVSSIVIAGLIDEAVGDDHEHFRGAGRAFLDANLYTTLPLLVIVTALLLRLSAAAAGGDPSGGAPGAGASPAIVAAALGAGYFYALAGATVAHELTHRVASPLAAISARMLLAFTINPTFESYHILGHHRNVGAHDDPATARRGEYVLAFVVRTVAQQSIVGWRLEAQRLRHKGLKVWSWDNRVLGGLLCSSAILVTAAVTVGIVGVMTFLAAAVFGRILHEMVNYVQHYGITRAEGAPIEARHAWDCGRLLSNALQYNLPRHADHHMFASKPFWQLDEAAGAPKLPYGYQMMSMIALFPAWWHEAVDPLLADWDRELADDSQRSKERAVGRDKTMQGPTAR
jgi:alkane 1-monooxygenase